ncbi:cyclase family protein [Streptomyces sp. YS415]|uniref:cyclase family protein n=1 Tax=Streptomyces sp. YS415 TaxID=2944806 RepID=UPI00202142A5|nr:cyclase family protein [Streptomyces sp. YS415]MCL7425421.1 cyclase family protein [Streptomyces sp. YS415]
MTSPTESSGAPRMTATGFQALYRFLRSKTTLPKANGKPDALRHLTPERVAAAVAEVRLGRTVSLAAPIGTTAGPDDPEPAVHTMTGPALAELNAPGLHFATDRFAMNVHSNANSHLDALCHVVFDGELYGGVPAGTVRTEAAGALTVDLLKDGLVGRGVLLDIPRLRGVPWLEPGDHVTTADLTAAEAAQEVRVGPGDLLFIRVGHRRRRTEHGPWDASVARTGLHPTALRLLAEREVAVMGSDGNNDTAPSAVEDIAFPVHVLAIQAMGIHLMDYLQFEDLTPICAQAGRWSFLCVVAPLRLPGATGSPVNPIAVL